ncbi:type IV secretion system protein VirB3 [Novosphingobium sp.]|jgi:type IV secretion system protein VirB3|uniref:type IV secretion system protein VirB3 n=1 Tax=Novosphingobium sp. TaxID=1874826 RepID=UPI002FDFFECC
MSAQLQRDTVFTALTRPQMFAGVTYTWFVANGILAAELFLIFKSFWVVLIALIVHLVGGVLSLREPRFLDLWIVKVSRCPRVKNYGLWQCNSYRP